MYMYITYRNYTHLVLSPSVVIEHPLKTATQQKRNARIKRKSQQPFPHPLPRFPTVRIYLDLSRTVTQYPPGMERSRSRRRPTNERIGVFVETAHNERRGHQNLLGCACQRDHKRQHASFTGNHANASRDDGKCFTTDFPQPA